MLQNGWCWCLHTWWRRRCDRFRWAMWMFFQLVVYCICQCAIVECTAFGDTQATTIEWCACSTWTNHPFRQSIIFYAAEWARSNAHNLILYHHWAVSSRPLEDHASRHIYMCACVHVCVCVCVTERGSRVNRQEEDENERKSERAKGGNGKAKPFATIVPIRGVQSNCDEYICWIYKFNRSIIVWYCNMGTFLSYIYIYLN